MRGTPAHANVYVQYGTAGCDASTRARYTPGVAILPGWRYSWMH